MARTVFNNANLLDGEHPAQPDRTVVVDGDRIVSVDSGPLAPEPGDRVIDCRGRTVMPGMVSGHYHSTYNNVTAPLQTPLGLEKPPAYQAYVAAHNVRLALRGGFTSVVGANEAWDIDPAMKEAIQDGLLVGPRIVAGSREIITSADSNDTVPWWWESKALHGVRVANGPDEFRRAVREEIKRGAEIIKLFASGGHGVALAQDVSSATVAELAAATEAAHRLGMRTRAHTASKRGILNCVEADIDVIDHGDGLDEECIDALVEADKILVPSLHAEVRILPHLPQGSPFEVEFTENVRAMCDILPLAVEKGLKICLGDDYGTQILPHGCYGEELRMYAEITKLPPLEIIRWATVHGGAIVGLPDLGRIEPGAIADLVVVDGDPSDDLGLLADVKNVHAVMRDGQLLVDELECEQMGA